MDEIKQKARLIKLVIFDIDGVLTSGQIMLDAAGQEFKIFFSHDGVGFRELQKQHIAIGIISGRKSLAVQKRMAELDVPESHIYLGYGDKRGPYRELREKLRLTDQQIAYVGDDLPDLPLIETAGLGIAVANAVPAVLAGADYCTVRCGGQGAAREVCDLIIQTQQDNHAI